jgi:serine/threonine protein kinase
MGVVYKAYRVTPGLPELPPGTLVALKVIQPDQQLSEKDRARFKREVELCHLLRHPHIVPILDHCAFGEDLFWFAMEYVAGEDAGKRAPFSIAEALIIADHILAALDYAHHVEIPGLIRGKQVIQRGIVHRDLKPANIMVTGRGQSIRARLTDFGLAKAFQFAGSSSFTETGEIGGTMTYISPDQLLNYREVGPAADLYSFGATLYTLLTGEVPYRTKGLDWGEILEANIVPLLDHTPLAAQAEPQLWAALAKVIETAMQKNPEARYPSAAAMRTALATISRGEAHG